MKKIVLSVICAGAMFIGNANTLGGEVDCFDAVCGAADEAVEDNPNISDDELTDVMNDAYADCWEDQQ